MLVLTICRGSESYICGAPLSMNHFVPEAKGETPLAAIINWYNKYGEKAGLKVVPVGEEHWEKLDAVYSRDAKI